jgi:hypothetical protein
VQAVKQRANALRAEQLSYINATFHVELAQASEVAGPAAAPTTGVSTVLCLFQISR